jgi:hypothetical protein
MTRSALVKLFDEAIPPGRQEAPGALATLDAWEKDVEKNRIANLLTLGAWSALNGPPAKPATVEPTAEERRKSAPISERLADAFPFTHCAGTPGVACETITLYRRPADAARTPLTVDLVLFLAAKEARTSFRRERECRVLDSVKVPLPEAPTLEERFAARFPEGLRPLSALRR